MSDVPELDKLIEEHENVKRNLRFLHRDRMFKRHMLSMITIVILTIPLLLILRDLGAIIISVWFGVSIIDMFYNMILDLLKEKEPKIDLTKRYHYK
jgi:hypothetical protein